MSMRTVSLGVALGLTFALASTTQAQTNQLHFGPRLSYQLDLEEFGIGAQFSVPLAQNLEIYPSFDYFLTEPGLWSFNGDLKYRIATESVDWLYVGGGLNLLTSSGNSNAGLNLFAGFESLSGRVHPFGEFRFTANNGSSAQASAGLNFTTGSS